MSELFEPVAIIGLAARFPGAADASAFWHNLREGRDSIAALTEEDLLAAGESPDRVADRAYVRAAGLIPDVDRFDAGYFKMNPREAQTCDPQLRLILEMTDRAIADAGHHPGGLGPDVAVFAAGGRSRYATGNLLTDPSYGGRIDFGTSVLTDPDYLATLISYKFGFRGPSMSVLTACSSALTAIHLACQSLQVGDCDVAVAGAANVELPYGRGYRWIPGDVRTPDGHCRPFDAMASGTLFSSGAGAVVLKRLADSIVDGDRIRGVIRGVGVTNDGSDKVSFSAPSVVGQSRAIVQAMQLAELTPTDISFVEMHATGTALGDPIEISALAEAYRRLGGRRPAPGSIPVGSVKSNIGHTAAAAGLAGLAKVLLALENQELPPTVNLGVLNPRLDLDTTPFRVPTRTQPWARTPGKVRRAGLSSLGVGGTNVHLVVEEAPERPPTPPRGRARVVVWSTRDDESVTTARTELAEHLGRLDDDWYADTVATLQHGRPADPIRGALVSRSAGSAATELAEDRGIVTGKVTGPSPRVAFVFPADLPAGAASGLYGRQRIFTEEADVCLDAFARTGIDLYDGWLGAGPARPSAALLFTVQYSLARQLIDWGITPASLIASGAGSAAAAAVAGTTTFEAAVAAVAAGEPVPPPPSHDAGLFVTLGPAAGTDIAVLPATAKSPDADEDALLTAVARLWTVGVECAWERIYLDEAVQRLPVPGHPMRRDRHWVDSAPAGPPPESPFTRPGWAEDSTAASPDLPPGETCLLLAPDGDFAGALELAGLRVVRIRDVADLAGSVRDLSPDLLVHASPADAVFSLLELAQSGTRGGGQRLPGLVVLTREAVDVSGSEPVDPARAGLPAMLQSFALESPYQRFRLVDVGRGTDDGQLAGELRRGFTAPAVVALRGDRRWVPDERSYVPDVVTPDPIRENGVYVITGGLGGLGTELARVLAATGRNPRLVLLGRHPREFSVDGVAVHVVACDVADEQRLNAALDQATTRFGPVNGVFHLAGVPGEAMFPNLKRPDAEQVMRPKVDGTLALRRCLRDRPPVDFVACFSSQAARHGMLGGSDYAAANAVMDAVAATTSGWFSVNWPVWTEAGMAASGIAHAAAARMRVESGGAADLSAAARRRAEEDAAEPEGDDIQEETTIGSTAHWAMDEHRIGGIPVLPGTALVDLILTGYLRSVAVDPGPVMLRDVVFHRPLYGAEPHRVRAGFRRDGDRWQARVLSRPEAGGPWQQHATCTVAPGEPDDPKLEIESLQTSLAESEAPRLRSRGAMTLGPRWDNVRRCWRAEKELLLQMAMPELYLAEVSAHATHPALLDTATGFAAGPTEDGLFAPFTYKSLTWYRPLPATFYSHVLVRRSSDEDVIVDVTMADPDGAVVAAVEGLRLRRVKTVDLLDRPDAAATATDVGNSSPAGIATADGMELLFRLLRSRRPSLVGIRPRRPGQPLDAAPALPTAVPALRTAPPADEGPEPTPVDDRTVEERLIDIWRIVLGRRDVETDSDFFDFGGDSLGAVALSGRVRDTFGVELGVGDVFDYPTPTELAEVIEAAGPQ
jgi:acyl transferase domain-containing protein